MNHVRAILSGTRKLLKYAAIVMAAAQLVLGVAPAFESGAASASAHAESSGTKLHYAHNDADCIACQAAQILASAQRTERQSVGLLLAPVVTPVSHEQYASFTYPAPAKARDPPQTVA